MKKNRKNISRKAAIRIWSAGCMAASMLLHAAPVLAGTVATGITQIDQIFSALTTLLTAIVSGIGVIIAIPKIGEMAEAFQQKDNHGMWDAGKGLIAAAIMIFIMPILKLIGIV